MSYIKHEFETGDTLYASDLNEMDEQIYTLSEEIKNQSGGMTTGIARSLLNLFASVSHYDKDVSEYYQNLVNELGMYNITYNLTNVTSSNTNADIMANLSFKTTLTPKNGYVFDSVVVTMGGVDITATAYSDGVISIEAVTGNIVITANAILEDVLYNWDFTQSLADTVEGKEATPASTSSTPIIDENGMTFGSGKRVKILNIMTYNRTYEIDFSNTDYQNGEVNAILCGFALETGGSPQSCIAYRKTGYWYFHDASTSVWGEGGTHSDANLISGKTLKITIDSDGIMSAYVDGELIGKSTSAIDSSRTLFIFGSQTNGYYNMTVTGMRVYEGVR